ncbi:MAG: MBL fold metallo-hydrolase, partial [Spirochaetales bacterium]|nr:MBL fold metallo-hydrolase [Spirochaetales bacterium]
QWGGKVITHEILTDLLQEPERFFLPCLHLNPIKVDQSFKEGESIRWGEYTLHFYHFPGHTWWHQAILLEKPGLKVLFVGDAVDHVTHVRSIDCWNYNPISDDQGAARCVELLRETKPDYLAGGHSGLVKWDPAFLDEMQQFVEGRNSLLKRLIGREHADLGYDTYWLRADPFRNLTAPGATTPVKIKIRNHIPGARVTITPRLPEGWTAEPSLTTLTLPEKEEGICEFNITAPAELASERYLIGLETEMNGQAYGEQSLIIFDVGKWHDPDRRPERIQSVAAYAYGALPQN